MFLLYYDAATKQVKALNGSGRSGAKYTLETIRKDLKIADGTIGQIPTHDVLAATVPGAAAGWYDTVERFGSGKLNLSQILDPAIRLAENGFPVSEIASHSVSDLISAKTLLTRIVALSRATVARFFAELR